MVIVTKITNSRTQDQLPKYILPGGYEDFVQGTVQNCSAKNDSADGRPAL
jgi:hypothetical protein